MKYLLIVTSLVGAFVPLFSLFVGVALGDQEDQAAPSQSNAEIVAAVEEDVDSPALRLALSQKERAIAKATGKEKEQLLDSMVSLAVSIYQLHDRTVPVDGSVGRWPYPSVKSQGKPIFPGSDPKTIQDPDERAAYEKSLQDHEALLGKIVKEKQLLAMADKCVGMVTRDKSASTHRFVLNRLNERKPSNWIRNRIFDILDGKKPQKLSPLPSSTDAVRKGTSALEREDADDSGSETNSDQVINSEYVKNEESNLRPLQPAGEQKHAAPLWFVPIIAGGVVLAFGIHLFNRQ